MDKTTLHSKLRKLRDYWEERRGSRNFPGRADIDPIEFRYALGHVSLVEVLRAPLRFRYRLVATTITEHLGYEMTGKTVDQIPEPQVRAYVLARYRMAVEARRPIIEGGEEMLDDRLWRYQAIYLPLSSDGDGIDMLIVGRISERPEVLPGRRLLARSALGNV